MTAGKLEFFAANSGLATGTLDDHMFAYYAARSGLGSGTLADHMLAYFQAQNADPSRDLVYQQNKFYSGKVGHGGSLSDVMRDFFSAPPSGGGKPQHRVFGSPLTIAPENDGLPVRLASAFYVIGVTGWKIVGGRVWADSSAQTFAGFTGQLWTQGVTSIAKPTAPAQEVPLSAPTGGNRYTDFALTPVVMTAGVPYYIGYESASGAYFFDSSQPSSFVQASDGAPVYLAATDEIGFSRSVYAYTGGTDGGATAGFGIDILVEEP